MPGGQEVGEGLLRRGGGGGSGEGGSSGGRTSDRTAALWLSKSFAEFVMITQLYYMFHNFF